MAEPIRKNPFEGTEEFINQPTTFGEQGTPALDKNKQQAAAVSSVALDKPILPDAPENSVEKEAVKVAQSNRLSELEAQLTDVATDPRFDRKTKISMMSQMYSQAGSPPSLREAYMQILASKPIVQESGEVALQPTTIKERLAEVDQYYKKIDQYKQGLGLEGLDSLFGKDEWAIDDAIAGALVPFSFAPPLADAISSIMPELKTDWTDLFLVGSLRKEFSKRARDMAPEQQLELAEKITDYINKSEFYGTENDFIKVDLANALFDWRDTGDFSVWLDNAFSILDMSVILGALRIGGKTPEGVKKFLKLVGPDGRTNNEKLLDMALAREVELSAMGVLDSVNPEKAKELTEQGLADPSGNILSSLNSSKESRTVETVLPKLKGTKNNPSPSLVIDDDFGTINLSEAERVAKKQTVDDMVERLGVHPSNVHFKFSEGHVNASYQVTDHAGKPLKTKKNAKALKRSLDEFISDQALDGVTARVLVRDYETNEFVPLKDKKADLRGKKENEYMVSVDFDLPVTTGDALPESMVLAEGVSGRFARFWDKSSWMSPWANYATAQAADKFDFRLKELRKIIEPLSSASTKVQRKVYGLLELSDEESVWLTAQDIRNELGADKDLDKVIDAYQSVVRHQNVVHSLINDATYRNFIADGMKELKFSKNLHGDLGKHAVGKRLTPEEVKTLPSSVKKVYDPASGKIIDLPKETLSKKGVMDSLYKLAAPIMRDGNEIHYLYSIDIDEAISVHALPYNVVVSRPGYLTRMYDAGYLVQEVFEVGVNGGERVTRYKTVGIENTLGRSNVLFDQVVADAREKALQERRAKAAESGRDFDEEKFLEKLDAKLAKKYRRVRSDELSNSLERYDPTSLENLISSGQLFTSPRKTKEIRGMEVEVTDPITGKIHKEGRKVVRPFSEILEHSQTVAARIGTWDQTIAKLQKNWELDYGKQFSVDGNFPWFGDLPESKELKNMDPDLQRRYDDAVAMREYIQFMAGTHKTQTQKFMQRAAVSLAEHIGGSAVDGWKAALAERVYNARYYNPYDTLKSSAFLQYISMRPVRQALLQSNQIVLYQGRGDYAKYFWSGGGFQEYTAWWAGLASKSSGTFDEVGPRLAKALGVDFEEFSKDLETFERTGMPAGIDSHLWAAPQEVARRVGSLAPEESFAGDFGYNLDKTAANLHKYLRRYGFDLGEQTQILNSFLAEKRLWQTENPNMSWRDAAWDIGGRARALSGNMNRAGTQLYQEGALGAVFQFMSHATKMIQFLAPQTVMGKRIPGLSKIANKHITEAEKRKIWMYNTLAYGTGGWGLNEIWDDAVAEAGIEVPEQVTHIIREGILGAEFNMMYNLLFEGKTPADYIDGDYEDLEFSSSFSPAGGTPFWEANNPVTAVLETVFTSDQKTLQDFLGPGLDVWARRWEGTKLARHIVMDASYLDNDDRALAALLQIGKTIVLEGDAWERSRYEWAVNQYISRNGRKLGDATDGEVLLKALLGLRTRANNKLTGLEREISGVRGPYKINPEEEYSSLSQRATRDFDYITSTIELVKADEVTPDELMSAIQQMSEKNYMLMDDRERTIYRTRMAKKIANYVTDDGLENRLYKDIARVFPYMQKDPMKDMITEIENAPDFETKEQVLDMMNRIFY